MLLHAGQIFSMRTGNNNLSACQQQLSTYYVLFHPYRRHFLDAFLPYFDLLSFDFAGCGHS